MGAVLVDPFLPIGHLIEPSSVIREAHHKPIPEPYRIPLAKYRMRLALAGWFTLIWLNSPV